MHCYWDQDSDASVMVLANYFFRVGVGGSACCKKVFLYRSAIFDVIIHVDHTKSLDFSESILCRLSYSLATTAHEGPSTFLAASFTNEEARDSYLSRHIITPSRFHVRT